MYEAFYGMKHTPFGKDIPAERLYESKQVQDAKGRLQLPVTLLAHHSLVDGVHIARFYQKLTEHVSRIEE